MFQWIYVLFFVNFLNKHLNIFGNHKWKIKLSFLYVFLLLNYNMVQSIQVPSIQRRFMWKQMDSTMDGIINSVSTGTQAVKDMIGELLPSVQTTPPSTEYTTSTTTRIKYIIRKPTPMKVIKIRSPMKITKLLSMPTTITTTTNRNKINKFNELYAESLTKNTANLYLTDANKSQPIVNKSALKSSAMSKLHTNIMQDCLSNEHIEEDDIATDSSVHVNKIYKKPNSNTYEVVENIQENETDAFQGLFYTSNPPYPTTTTTTTTTTTDSPIITTTYIGRHNKLRDQKLLTTPETFSITDSWQPSIGFQASTKPRVVWRHENWPSIETVGETPLTSSIATFREKPKRSKNHTHKRLKAQEKREELLLSHQEQQQTETTNTTTTRNKLKRGSVKFADRIH